MAAEDLQNMYRLAQKIVLAQGVPHEALAHAERLLKEGDIQAHALILRQHALIVQFHHCFEGEHFEHDDQRAAIKNVADYVQTI